MKITCQCCCGAYFKASGETFIQSDMKANENGFRFVQQQLAKDWLDRHQTCSEFDPDQINDQGQLEKPLKH